MPDGEGITRAASALRTALAGSQMVRFDAPQLIGPTPQAGRTIERVGRRGTHLKIGWDDGVVLHTNLRWSGSWHLYRRGDTWRRAYEQMSVAIEVADWVAVCFNAALVETYRIPDRRRHPGMGRLGPDLGTPDADLAAVVNLLLSYPDRATPVADVLLDQRVMRGVGNVLRCEVLWARELSPFAPADALSEHDAIGLVNTAATMLRADLHHQRRATAHDHKAGLAVYGRNGQRCQRCGETIECRPVARRVLYWCHGCQHHLAPVTEATPPAMDPHPAAQAYLAGLPWNRDAG